MSPRRVQSASTGFANFVSSESHLMMDQRQPSCMLLLRLTSTIATQSMQEHRRRLRGVHTAYDVVRPPYVCRLMHTNDKMATEDEVTMSFWLLVVIFTCLVNFLVVEIDKLDLDASGFTTCCVVEMTWLNMPESCKNFGWTVTGSADTFGCQQSSLTMFWGWWGPCISRLPTVYVAVCVQGRTTSPKWIFWLRLHFGP